MNKEKKATKQVPTRQEVEAKFQAFLDEVRLATGNKGEVRARFAGFELRDGPKATYLDAVKAYGAGSFLYAANTADKAFTALRNAQKIYACKSIETYFPNKINAIPESVHQDIYDAVLKKYNVLVDEVKTVRLLEDFDLEKLSVLYWGVADAIAEVPALQEARDSNARMLAKSGRASKKQVARLKSEVPVQSPEDQRRQRVQLEAIQAAELKKYAEGFAAAL